MAMELVRCIQKSINERIKVGGLYWIDLSSIRQDSEGKTYGDVYLDSSGNHKIGVINMTRFTLYKALTYQSIETAVNSNESFLLKDIINKCWGEPVFGVGDHLLQFIVDKTINIPENMEREFTIISNSFKKFERLGMKDDYMKYMGYSLRCTDKTINEKIYEIEQLLLNHDLVRLGKQCKKEYIMYTFVIDPEENAIRSIKRHYSNSNLDNERKVTENKYDVFLHKFIDDTIWKLLEEGYELETLV